MSSSQNQFENPSKLPLPQNIEEDTDLYIYLMSLDLVSGWLDGTDQAEEDFWLDSDGNNITFFNWGGNQPDNWLQQEHVIQFRTDWGGYWNDIPDTYTDHVLCQKPSQTVGTTTSPPTLTTTAPTTSSQPDGRKFFQ